MKKICSPEKKLRAYLINKYGEIDYGFRGKITYRESFKSYTKKV